jgi:hypothetical protein
VVIADFSRMPAAVSETLKMYDVHVVANAGNLGGRDEAQQASRMSPLRGVVITDFSRVSRNRCTTGHVAAGALAQERVPAATQLEERIA